MPGPIVFMTTMKIHEGKTQEFQEGLRKSMTPYVPSARCLVLAEAMFTLRRWRRRCGGHLHSS